MNLSKSPWTAKIASKWKEPIPTRVHKHQAQDKSSIMKSEKDKASCKR